MDNFKKYYKWYFLVFIAAIAFFVWYAVFRESRKELSVWMLDVGQGDGIFIEAPSGGQILIDGGPNKKILQELGNIMPFYDKQIDAVLLTHPHEDHLNGLIEVLKKYRVLAVLESGNKSDNASYKEFENTIKQKNIPRFFIKKGTKININENAVLDILLPVFTIKNGDIHNQMVVAKLNYGKTDFLFTGDMEKNLENYLVLTKKENLKSDVLKIGHHGSRTSTSEEFLGWVFPQIALISAGQNNSYGHPTKEILNRLDSFAVKIFRTDLDGRIKIKSDGETIEVEK